MTQGDLKVQPSEEQVERRDSLKENTPTLSTPRSRVMAFYKSQNMQISKKVEEAIRNLVLFEKNATYYAIVKWIVENTGHESSLKLLSIVKKTITKGLGNGTIVRTRHSKKALGVNGSFMLKEKGKHVKPKMDIQMQAEISRRKDVKKRADYLRKEEKFLKTRFVINDI